MITELKKLLRSREQITGIKNEGYNLDEVSTDSFSDFYHDI